MSNIKEKRIGETVIIQNDSMEVDKYGVRAKYIGTVDTIANIIDWVGCNNTLYRVYILTNTPYTWDESMLRPIAPKKQLREFAIIQIRNGERFIVTCNINGLIGHTKGSFLDGGISTLDLNHFDNNLRHNQWCQLDIIACKNFKYAHEAFITFIRNKTVKWDWEEPPTMTVAEAEVKYNIKIRH